MRFGVGGALIAGAALTLPACAAGSDDGESSEIERTFVDVDDPAELEGEQELLGTSSEALRSYSFLASCVDVTIAEYSDGSVLVAHAYCRKRDGSWHHSSWGRGYCSGDLANCDGSVVCGSC
ncbi:hypothetical protein [Sorangium sp. So ce385]|uniref:hypothetical protein n=1 Tax=Sorangium sp. So ce385 TaxID=3133308 RepID=UPI003F5C150D